MEKPQKADKYVPDASVDDVKRASRVIIDKLDDDFDPKKSAYFMFYYDDETGKAVGINRSSGSTFMYGIITLINNSFGDKKRALSFVKTIAKIFEEDD